MTTKTALTVGLACAVGCWVEWTAYLACVAVFFAVIVLSPSGQRIKNVACFSAIALMGGLSLLAYYAWMVGLETYLYTISVRFGPRALVDYYSWADWAFSLFQSYWPWLVAVVLGVIVAALMRVRLPENALRWLVTIGVATFVLAENILMFEHSITYTFDRLKWGFLLSILLALAATMVSKVRPNLAITGLLGLCFGAGALSLLQYVTIYVPYWR